MSESTFHEPSRRTPVVARAEVVVLGGGPAGVAAAYASARSGRKTLLVERYGFLGGMGTIARVTSFCGIYGSRGGERIRVSGGFADAVLDRLAARDALAPPHSILGKTWGIAYDSAVYKGVLDTLVLSEGVELLLHALAVGVVSEGKRIRALLVETKSGRGAIPADVFVDASGDADLAAWAGAAWEQGSADGSWAYPTLMFRMGHVDDARALAEGKPRLRSLMAEAEAAGEAPFPRRSAYINPQPHAGEWRANVTQIGWDGRALDGTDAFELSYGEVEGRRQIERFFDFLKRRVPGFENAYLLDVAPQLGIRETRRLRGRYQLTRDDVVGGRSFDDAIGVNAWPVEIHSRGDTSWTFLEGRGYHDIPYAALLPDAGAPTNLLVAGRCASATHEAQASLRVTGPCFVMGEAAGVAASLAVAARSGVADVDIGELRASLRERGTVFDP